MPTPMPTPPTYARRLPLALALLVPLLAVASAALLVAHFSFEGDTFQHCRYLGPFTRLYVTAWAAPLCGLAALALLLALRRGARGRGGSPGPGRVATAATCLVPVLLLAQLTAL
ncbi:hypothetical protein [Streptomyces sp. NPDC002790]|uniref:hypothetical protein n=1 Tax=Streptomyces sp. NPDC002790 TaxID=3154431 RepID=UPI00331952A5